MIKYINGKRVTIEAIAKYCMGGVYGDAIPLIIIIDKNIDIKEIF